MTENFIAKNPNKKIILDGVIRSKDQNDALSHLFGDFKVIYFELSEDTAVERLSGRRIDPVTQETFPASFTGDTNPKTGNTLITRADDIPEAIRKRIAWSIADTLPLINIWEEEGHQVYKLDASQSEDIVFAEIKKIIE